MKSSKSYFIPMVTLWAWAMVTTAQVAPNVLFFLVDDLGYMDVGANHPGTFYETPILTAWLLKACASPMATQRIRSAAQRVIVS